ncbi:hypothetical protein [Pseudoalteromonas luteoviolacea]|uniref:Bacterial inner membrane protein n=1 Tax=Pseudoalteromonas luteoviolacea (strain 2ta16) TaxID=1353533 RepID=V4HV01_PSEL2|nr:hypothetical protein [Pseudoalteromonas luteoviolacea]ESP94655.1 hypothetical protein PL2TA16_00655 [Pseudoalteromonas luteoviolacea 2ta16]KZN32354.1 hypothetical protein N483_04160 [Pseudoalteromonas luteoviolacea NCIMB 1944]
MNIMNKLNVLHLDGSAGLTMGMLLFLLQDWVASLYRLPDPTVHFLATANVCYGVYALTLAFSNRRNSASISLLVTANIIWAVVCVAIVLHYFQTASLIGLAFICMEGIFVIVLAFFEWKSRRELLEICHVT